MAFKTTETFNTGEKLYRSDDGEKRIETTWITFRLRNELKRKITAAQNRKYLNSPTKINVHEHYEYLQTYRKNTIIGRVEMIVTLYGDRCT